VETNKSNSRPEMSNPVRRGYFVVLNKSMLKPVHNICLEKMESLETLHQKPNCRRLIFALICHPIPQSTVHTLSQTSKTSNSYIHIVLYFN
jgi:hypothetical protein